MISREEAIGILSNNAQNAANILAVIPKSAEEKAQALMNEIEALDMAIEALFQPERPKGQWIESIVIQTDTSELCEYTCSVCSIVTTRKSNFCPNCGADMRDGEE